mmetsp:Transcript_52357/g.113458  ORF Transcript_52357/g.113458 Transcript_52357/m.113458 type:complete len:329 (-) Transcript_52357:242-1228(-)
MEAIGEEIFGIVVKIYPELAGKLTGMLLQLGQEECEACLESQERLAERLDEAFAILDASGQCLEKKAPEERRIDPEDGKARTYEELKRLCAGHYTAAEIDEYWKACKPINESSSGQKEAAPVANAPLASTPLAQPVVAATQDVSKASVPSSETLPGLTAWLAELKLSKYSAAASEWIEEQGACNLDEVLENLDDFADALGLKPLERGRMEKSGPSAAAVAMAAAAESKDQVTSRDSPERSAPVAVAAQERDVPPDARPGSRAGDIEPSNPGIVNARETLRPSQGPSPTNGAATSRSSGTNGAATPASIVADEFPALGATQSGKKGKRR